MTNAAPAIPTDHDTLVEHLRNLPTRDRARLADPLAAQLREQGHPDALAAAVDMLERATAEIGDDSSEQIPTDPAGLYQYLAELPSRERPHVADRLAIQLGGTPDSIERAVNMVGSALEDIENDEECDRKARLFAEQLAATLEQLGRTRRTLDDLMSDGLFHVEYAESRTGLDLAAFLDDAGRMLRAATALNPCPPKPNGTAQ